MIRSANAWDNCPIPFLIWKLPFDIWLKQDLMAIKLLRYNRFVPHRLIVRLKIDEMAHRLVTDTYLINLQPSM